MEGGAGGGGGRHDTLGGNTLVDAANAAEGQFEDDAHEAGTVAYVNIPPPLPLPSRKPA